MSTTFAKRYAKAAFEIAQEKNELEKWQPDLKRVAELTQDAEFTDLMENPKLRFELKAKLVKEKLGKINPLALNLAYLLVVKGRLKSAEQIANEYERLLNEHHGIKHAEIITAIPLSETDKKRLIHRLEAMLEKRVSISLQVDPSIVGGIVAKIDGSIIDGSIRNKLTLLKKSMSETMR